MRVFLAELASVETRFPGEIERQGRAMLDALASGARRAGHEPVVPEKGGTLEEAVEELAPGCDRGLVVAPDDLLADHVTLLREHTRDLGPSPEYVETAADKLETLETLEGEVPVPALDPGGEAVVKPVTGCSSEDVRVTEEEPGPDEFATERVEGTHASAVLVEGKAVALSQQLVTVDDGRFVYRGNRAPLRHPLREEAFEVAETAARAPGTPGGIVGVDLVLGDEPVVIEVNPRPTVSIVPLERSMRPSPSRLLFEGLPRDAELLFSGEAEFRC
ncbi:MAG: Tyramine--L-glutamate ligase [Methanonatronarchaeales archaeon]|nr:Tyramine--L-glutamate ligase [Methanonatronarchaeales archaeon]